MEAPATGGGRGTILVVEDDEELRDIIADILESCGYEVIPAGNGKQAADFLAATAAPPAMILLDLMMPIVNGWELLRDIQADSRLAAIPVVVMTAIRRDRPAGVTALLKKPFSLRDLIETVGGCVDAGTAVWR
jgi:CheY-like chemotaxis protein